MKVRRKFSKSVKKFGFINSDIFGRSEFSDRLSGKDEQQNEKRWQGKDCAAWTSQFYKSITELLNETYGNLNFVEKNLIKFQKI